MTTPPTAPAAPAWSAAVDAIGLLFLLAGLAGAALEEIRVPTNTGRLVGFGLLAILGALMLPRIGDALFAAGKRGASLVALGRRAYDGKLEVDADPAPAAAVPPAPEGPK